MAVTYINKTSPQHINLINLVVFNFVLGILLSKDLQMYIIMVLQFELMFTDCSNRVRGHPYNCRHLLKRTRRTLSAYLSLP